MSKSFITSIFNKYRNLILYVFFGVAAVLIDYGVFFVLEFFDIIPNPEISSIIGNVCGFIFTFTTNTFLNFKKSNKIVRRFLSYALVCILGAGVSTLLIYLLKSYINLYILKIGVMGVVCILQFILNKFITYRD